MTYETIHGNMIVSTEMQWTLENKLNFCKYMARDNFLEKNNGPSRIPKTFAKLRNIYPNHVYNKGTNYNLVMFKNVEHKCVKNETIH